MPTVDFQDVKLQDRRVSGSGLMVLGRTLFNRQDYNPEMQGQAGSLIYEKMRRDPEIAGALQRWKSVLGAASWKFDEPKKRTSRTKAMMEMCDQYIMRRFKGELLPQMLLKLDFGFSAIEKLWTVNEKGQQVYARFAPILPQSVREFEIDDLGRVARLVQFAYVPNGAGGWTFRRQAIPDPEVGGTAREKLAVFTYRKEGDDPFGRALLREVYQPWFHKSELWALDGLAKERAALGLLIIKIPTTLLDPNDAKYIAAQEIIQNTRASEYGGMVVGEDWSVDHKHATGTPPDIRDSQDYCGEQINRAMLTQFALLASGSSTGGGRSLGESQTDHFMLCLQSLADSCEEDVDEDISRPQLERNFGAIPDDEMPRFKCENLTKLTGERLATVMSGLKDFFRYDRKLEEHLRESNDLPPIDDATREEAPDPLALAQAQAKQGDGSQPGGKPAPAEPDNDKNKPPVSKAATADSPSAAPSRFWREAMPHEAHVDFEAMEDYLDQEPTRIWYRVVKPFRDQQIASMAAAAAGSTVANLSNGILFGPGTKVPRQARMAEALGVALLDAYKQGRASVVSDKRRQPGYVKAEGDEEDDDEIEITPKQRKWIEQIASGFVVASTFKLIAESVKSGLSAHQQELPRAEVEAAVRIALTNLSEPVVIADLSGAVARSFTTGRVEQGADMAEDLTSIFYSARMDRNTCGPCEAMDGAELDRATWESQLPNPNCEGGDRCRCEPVFVFRTVQQREAA